MLACLYVFVIVFVLTLGFGAISINILGYAWIVLKQSGGVCRFCIWGGIKEGLI